MSVTTIPTAGLADDAVDNTKLDLTSNYAFTGTVTGAGGITMVDSWRLTSNTNVTANQDAFLTANLEQDDTSGFANIGSSMTESSGVFTFPSTGIYQIILMLSYSATSTNQDFYMGAKIFTTTNNSSYTARTAPYTYSDSGGSTVGQLSTTICLFDVTSTSTHKVKFGYECNNSNVQISGNTDVSRTQFQFIRLGDT